MSNKRLPDVGWMNEDEYKRLPDVGWMNVDEYRRLPDVGWMNVDEYKWLLIILEESMWMSLKTTWCWINECGWV